MTKLHIDLVPKCEEGEYYYNAVGKFLKKRVGTKENGSFIFQDATFEDFLKENISEKDREKVRKIMEKKWNCQK